MGQKSRATKRVKLVETSRLDSDPDLESKRRKNEIKLRGTFEAIFEKYARDFDGVGDEVDIETGEITVDNGHVRGMRHERDVLTRKACILKNKASSRAIDTDDGAHDELSTPPIPSRHQENSVSLLKSSNRKPESSTSPTDLNSLSMSACLARGIESTLAGQTETTATIDHAAVFKLGQHIALQLAQIMTPNNQQYSGLQTPTSLRSFTPDTSRHNHLPRLGTSSSARSHAPTSRPSHVLEASRRISHAKSAYIFSNFAPPELSDSIATPSVYTTKTRDPCTALSLRHLGAVTESVQPTDFPLSRDEPATNRRAFTKEEDLLLLKLKKKHRTPWPKILLRFPGRSLDALHARYQQLSLVSHESTTDTNTKIPGNKPLNHSPNAGLNECDGKNNINAVMYKKVFSPPALNATRISARIMAKQGTPAQTKQPRVSNEMTQTEDTVQSQETFLHALTLEPSPLLLLPGEGQPRSCSSRIPEIRYQTRSNRLNKLSSTIQDGSAQSATSPKSSEPAKSCLRGLRDRCQHSSLAVGSNKRNASAGSEESYFSAVVAAVVIPPAQSMNAPQDKTEEALRKLAVTSDVLPDSHTGSMKVGQRKGNELGNVRNRKPERFAIVVPQPYAMCATTEEVLEISTMSAKVPRKRNKGDMAFTNVDKADIAMSFDEITLPIRLAPVKPMHRHRRPRALEDLGSEDELA